MVVSLGSKPRRVQRWYTAHIYLMYNFRTLFEREKNSTTPQARHLHKKIEQHIKYGVSMNIPEDEIMKLQADIIKEIKNGKDVKAIIKALLRENGQK